MIRTICSPYGFVQRIVVFRKNGLQVLVEYPVYSTIMYMYNIIHVIVNVRTLYCDSYSMLLFLCTCTCRIIAFLQV